MTTIECQSAITRVTVYARGAVVTRRIDLPPLPADACTLKLAGISPWAATGSMRVTADGERPIVGLTSRFVSATQAPAVEPPQLAGLRREQERLEALHERATSRRDRLSELELTSAIVKEKIDTSFASRVSDALAVSALLLELTCKLDDEIAALEKRQDEVATAIEEAAQAAALTGAAPKDTREVEISLGPGPTHLRALELSYAVAGARWWPAYSLRITESGKRAELGLEAFVAQCSLEDWNGVALTLCTADMIQDIRLPELASLRLGRAQPPKRRGWRAPPEGLEAMFAGYDAAGGFLGATPAGRLLRPEE